MPDSNKKPARTHYIVFIVWLFFTLIAAIYFIQGRLNSFDPDMKLVDKQSSLIINQVRELKELKNVDLKNSIIHFTSNDCSCTPFSREHKASINEQAKRDGFNIINITLPSDSAIIIPSTPSILITNEAENLLYFGPYSVGLACSESNGYVETVLHNYAKGYNSDLIISDAEGCYCNI